MYTSQKIFLKISTKEWLSGSWNQSDRDTKSPHIRKMIHNFNEITRWVIYEVLEEQSTPKSRALVIRHFISIADVVFLSPLFFILFYFLIFDFFFSFQRCRLEKNYNALQGIVSGLQSASVHRLQKSWNEVPKTNINIFRELEALVSPESNFESLRCKLLDVNPPCVPWIGLYLRDLTFVEDGNPNLQKGTKLVNFEKFRKLSATVKYIQVYQAQHYSFIEVPAIVAMFTNNKAFLSDENEQFALSLKLEPKEPPPQ